MVIITISNKCPIYMNINWLVWGGMHQFFCHDFDVHTDLHTVIYITHCVSQRKSNNLPTCSHRKTDSLFCSSDWCPRGRRECGGVRRQLVPAALLWQRRRAVQGVGQTDTAGGQTAACRTAGRTPRRHHLHSQQGGGARGGMLLVFYQSVNDKFHRSLIGSWIWPMIGWKLINEKLILV